MQSDQDEIRIQVIEYLKANCTGLPSNGNLQ